MSLTNTDFDTSRPAVHGEYILADETYADLLDRLESEHVSSVPEALRRNIAAFYDPAGSAAPVEPQVRKRLAQLNARIE